MVGVEQRLRLVDGQPLDPERARRRDPTVSTPSRSACSARATGVVVGEDDLARRLAGQLQLPAVAAAAQARGLAAPRQRGEQRLGPEVLVEVEPGTSFTIHTISTELIEKS